MLEAAGLGRIIPVGWFDLKNIYQQHMLLNQIALACIRARAIWFNREEIKSKL
jgi:hypothetical protein